MSGSRRWHIAQAAELRWWRRYLSKTTPGDYLDRKAGQWREKLALIGDELDLRAGATVLDAGCGPAGIYMVLPECEVHAVDPLIDAYENCLPHFERQAWPWVTFYPVPFEEFTAPEAYDFVFCINAVNHFSDLDLSLDRLLDVLAPGGRLILSSDAHNHALFKHLFRALPLDILHPHQYSADEYEAMFTARGAHIEKRMIVRRAFFFDRWLWVVRRSG